MRKKPLTNLEVREWYLKRVARIPELNKKWLAQKMPLKERAKAAWKVRHDARLKAREMMTNPEDVRNLQRRDIDLYGNPDGPTFDFLVEKLQNEGLEGNDVYKAIIEDSYHTNAGVNKKLGL